MTRARLVTLEPRCATLRRTVAEQISMAVTVGCQGRLVVPARLRRQLGIEPGDVLLARIEDNRLVLERREATLARARARFRVVPPQVSIVDDLIAGRREEAKRENQA